MATLSSTGRFAAGEACADNDILYGPYATVAAAHAALLNAEQNVVGRTVGIQTGNTIEEYWYQGGTTEQHLVKKQSSEVEANPTDEATESLEKIKIGETIYEISEGIPTDMNFDKKLQTQANINNQESSVAGRLGYVVLQPEKQGDVTTTFAAQIANKPNTIFEIRDVFVLGQNEVTIPAGCTLKFVGGEITNGTLICNGTTIENDCARFSNVVLKGTITNGKIKTSWFDKSSYTNDYQFLKMYFAFGQTDDMNGIVYEMSGDYKLDIEDYDERYSPSEYLGRFFIISHSFVLRGNNVAFHIVKNGVPLTLSEADDGECRGMFGIFPVISGAVFDISGATFDAGIGEEFGTLTTSTSLRLNRNIFKIWRSSSIVIDGRTATGNITKGVVDNCIFEHCYCETLICMDGVFAIKDHFICRNSTFRNSAGAAYNVSGASIVENCVFEHLTNGGAIETTLRNFASTIVSGCKFVNVQLVCSVLDGYNENSYKDALSRSFVFENCICKNSDEFNTLVTTGGGHIYGIELTAIAVCRILGSYFENFGGDGILTHAETNPTNNRLGIHPDVFVEGCTFRLTRVTVGSSSSHRRFSFVKCVSYGDSICRMPGVNNAVVNFKDCMYKYEVEGAASNLAADFPIGTYVDIIAKAKNENGLGAYKLNFQDATRGKYLLIRQPASSSDTEMTVNEERFLDQIPNSRASIGQMCSVRMNVVDPVGTTTTEVTIRVGIGQEMNFIGGTTANRPTNVPIGHPYYDTDIERELVWNGTSWDIVDDKMVVDTAQPNDGFLPNVMYNLGELTGSVAFVAASAVTGIVNLWYITFDTGATPPTIDWTSMGITAWYGGNAPTLNGNKHYEISILNGIATCMEV